MRLTFATLIIALTFDILAQDSTRVNKSDSPQHLVIHFTPYYTQQLRTSGNYIKIIDDSTLFQLSTGISIFNTLRGQVPGLNIPSYFSTAHYTGMRTEFYTSVKDALIIIDGAPFNNSIGSYYNLNAFEFSSISAVSDINALTFIGGGNSGAFILQSRTGEGLVKPKFEFNTYATNGWGEYNDISGTKNRIDEWYLSNSLSYSQDFGAIDTRVSYNFLFNPNDQVNYTPAFHGLKINTGVMVSSKLDFRIILDGRFTGEEEKYITRRGPIPMPVDTIDLSEKENFYQGNLAIRYKVLDWLHLSSQLIYTSRDSSWKSLGTTIRRKSEVDDSRQLANFFINVNRPLSEEITLSGFAGIQYGKQMRRQVNLYTDSIGTYTAEEEWEQKMPQISAHAHVAFGSFLDVAVFYRLVESSNQPDEDDQTLNYSVSSSFVFTQLWKPRILSFGKVRASMGSNYIVPFSNYPVESANYLALPLGKRSPYAVTSLEFGGDFNLMNSLLNLSLNYFDNKVEYEVPPNIINALSSWNRRGWEAEIEVILFRKKGLSYEMGVLLSAIKSRADVTGSGNNDSDFSDPDIKASLYSKVGLKTFVFAFLIESVNAKSGFLKSSFTKLRDISMGYQLPLSWMKGIGISKTVISISARNLYMITSSGIDYEQYYSLETFQKSASIGLNIEF